MAEPRSMTGQPKSRRWLLAPRRVLVLIMATALLVGCAQGPTGTSKSYAQQVARPGAGVQVTAARADLDSGYFEAEVLAALLAELGYQVSSPAAREMSPDVFYPADTVRRGQTNGGPDCTADPGDRHRLGEELQQNVAPPRTNSLPNPDFSCALGDRRQQNIHDPDSADDERDARDRSHEQAKDHQAALNIGQLRLRARLDAKVFGPTRIACRQPLLDARAHRLRVLGVRGADRQQWRSRGTGCRRERRGPTGRGHRLRRVALAIRR